MSQHDLPPVLYVSRVSAAIAGKPVLKAVSLRLQAGQCYALLGPNGSGKTTLMRVALGMLRPSYGTVRLLGAPPPPRSGGVSASFGPRLMHPRRRVRTELWLRIRAAGGDRQAADRAWAETGLSDARAQCGDLSLGQAQRLAIVCALTTSPRFVVLDEPTTGLDAGALGWLRDRLSAYVAASGCAWVSSHDLHVVAQLGCPVTVLNNGQVTYHGAVDCLAGPGSQGVRLRSSRPTLLLDTLANGEFRYRADSDGGVTIFGESAEDIGRLLAERRIPLTFMAEEHHGLDDSLAELIAADATGVKS
jgi:ABC-2 type transport system ATP-binding protein